LRDATSALKKKTATASGVFLVIHTEVSEINVMLLWSSCPDDVRTWLEDRAEDFRIPEAIMPNAVYSTP
jgi:hypothetical protein